MNNLFNTVIEIPFENYDCLVKRRSFLNLKLDNTQYYFVFSNAQLKIIQDIINNNILLLTIEDFHKSESIITQNICELVKNLDIKYKNSNIDLSFCHEILDKDTNLRKKVIELFFKQNKNLFLNHSKPVSLLNGLEGYFTVRVSFITIKNHEE